MVSTAQTLMPYNSARQIRTCTADMLYWDKVFTFQETIIRSKALTLDAILACSHCSQGGTMKQETFREKEREIEDK